MAAKYLAAASSFVYNTTVGVATVCALSGVYLLRRYAMGQVCPSKALMSGKTVIVTGANTGIGKQTAMELAKRKARVIMACRNREAGERATREVQRVAQNDQVSFCQVDLASFSSIREFSKKILQEEKQIDVLVNNAGVFMMPLRWSKDGVEMHLAVNYLGQFLLTALLLDRMKEMPSARIVNLAADIPPWLMDVNFDDINSKKSYNRVKAVAQSKTCVLLATQHLATLLADTNVTVNSVHPGLVRNEFGRYLDYWYGYFQLLLYPLLALILKSPKQGAQTSIYCAVAEELDGVSGRHFRDCQDANLTLPPSLDKAAAEKLWDISMKMTGMKAVDDTE